MKNDLQPVQYTSEMVYPISSSYWHDWDIPKALAELIANMLDEKVPFTCEWSNGWAVLEDQSAGVPRSGLVIGLSSKGDDQIGQFGEGMQAASLVLPRSGCRMRLETVGYGFDPRIEADATLDAEVLKLRFFESGRTVGTRVSVECSQGDFKQARERFLQFDPNYVAPEGPGRPLTDVKPGSIYIGGVMVQKGCSLALSYDMSTARAKGLQNRDRSVIDGSERAHVIQAILVAACDASVIATVVRAALKGKAAQEEVYGIAYPSTPAARQALEQARTLLWGKQAVAIKGDDELNLMLKDQGYVLIDASRHQGSLHRVLDAMGIQSANAILSGKVKRPREKKEIVTKWVADNALDTREKSVLARTTAVVRALFGAEALARVRAYESTRLEGVDTDLRWGGFYDPRTGTVAVQRKNLSDFGATLELLIHESAHRLRHKVIGGYDYGDRTRGFESQLVSMAADATRALLNTGWTPARAQAPVARPAGRVASLLMEQMKVKGIRSGAALARVSYAAPAVVSKMLSGRADYWRAADVDAVCAALDLHPGPVVLAGLATRIAKDAARLARHWRRNTGRCGVLWVDDVTARIEAARDDAVLGEAAERLYQGVLDAADGQKVDVQGLAVALLDVPAAGSRVALPLPDSGAIQLQMAV